MLDRYKGGHVKPEDGHRNRIDLALVAHHVLQFGSHFLQQRSVGLRQRAYAGYVVLRHGQQVVIRGRPDVFEDADALVLEQNGRGRVLSGGDLAEYAPFKSCGAGHFFAFFLFRVFQG